MLETEGIKLVVRRASSGQSAVEGALTQPETRRTAQPPTVTRIPAPVADADPTSLPNGGRIVGAPMVGTFYRAPSPDKPPFVEVGAVVKVGDPLCVIEVMKLFTTIHAEFAGTIRQIGAEDGQFVEFGQMIFVME